MWTADSVDYDDPNGGAAELWGALKLFGVPTPVDQYAVRTSKTDDPTSKQRNVLFMAVDDLRPQIAAFGASMMKTPNIDRLAQEGVVFEHAYVQYSFCAPSRNSFLSGRRPDATQAFSFMDHFREQGVGDSWSSFPQYFRDRGYTVLGVGKLFVSAALPFPRG